MSKQPSRSTNLAIVLVDLLLFVSLATVLFVVGTAVIGEDHQVLAHQEVRPGQLASLPPEVMRPQTVPVTIHIRNADTHQVILDLARGFLQITPWLALLWLMRSLLLSVREGDPFTAANVRRLRTIGFLLLFGYPLVTFLGQIIERQLASSSTVGEFGTRFPGDFGPVPVVALGVFVLAQVFAHGVRLREDVEGTV
jgi:hypothetical protein